MSDQEKPKPTNDNSQGRIDAERLYEQGYITAGQAFGLGGDDTEGHIFNPDTLTHLDPALVRRMGEAAARAPKSAESYGESYGIMPSRTSRPPRRPSHRERRKT